MSRLAPVPEPSAARRVPTKQATFAFLQAVREVPEGLSLENVDAETVHDAIAAWTDLGHAITFGLTSDGGAISVSMLHHGKRDARYFTSVAELEDWLKTVAVGSRSQ